jgi:hypothetical protein
MPAFPFPQYVVIDQEILRLIASSPDGLGFAVDRALHTTTAVIHKAAAVVFPLKQMTVSFPFLEGFFGTPAAGNWTQSVVVANAKICSAELFATNSRGNGPATSGQFTSLVGGGLRTLTGGQVMLQVPGYLAVQNGAVPPLDPGAVYAVRDVYAYVGTPPGDTASISLQVTMDGQNYGAPLVIEPHKTESVPLDGSTLPVLRAGRQIGLNILSVGEKTPGSDLTVVIRV